MKTRIKQFLREQQVYVYRRPPRGLDLAFDLAGILPRGAFKTVFDVGANVGQSTASFLDDFPQARVWCFEPSGELHANLGRRFAGNPRVTCERLALGSAAREARLNHAKVRTMFHLAADFVEAPPDVLTGEFETVRVATLDAYRADAGIGTIDFLKIDTEGHDLEVLRGAPKTLSEGAATFVQCECSMNPENRFHRSFEDVKAFMENYGYRIFGFYEQVDEVFSHAANLRRANVMFVSPSVLHGAAVH